MTDMKDFFTELLQYNFDSNQQLVELFNQQSSMISDRSKMLFSHVLNAQHIWNHRILSEKFQLGVWEIHALNDLQKINEENFQRSLKILETDDLERKISYSNSQGKEFSNTVRDILFHIINHSTYHRAQIATDLKASGVQPLATDYIVYKRGF